MEYDDDDKQQQLRSSTCVVTQIAADVVLWRRSDVSASLLAAAVSGWLLLRLSTYTLLSLLCNVLLLLLSTLFLWAKAARLLNRPEPPIPEMRISQQLVNDVAALLHSALNAAFSAFHHIALARDPALFYLVFPCLWLLSLLASLTDLPTFCFACTVAVLTVPGLYRQYEECIGRYTSLAYSNLRMYEMVYERFSLKCFHCLHSWVVEVLKEP